MLEYEVVQDLSHFIISEFTSILLLLIKKP